MKFWWCCGEYWGHGLGKWLIEVVLSHPMLESLAWHLATEDAHELYRKYRFTELKQPEIHMERGAIQDSSPSRPHKSENS